MEIRRVGVLGCGLMGSGIAQVCAAAGYKTVVREVDDATLQKGLSRVRQFLDTGVMKGKVTAAARDRTLGNLTGTTTFEALAESDKAMTLGCGHPMGPLTLLDFVGLDTTYYVANVMFDEFREPAYAAPPLLKRMVLAGRLGRKSGRGFYSYER